MALSVNSVVNLLQQEFGLEPSAQRAPDTITFDAILRSREDPMPLIIIEDISRSSDKSVREKCRKLESFIWNLYRAGKVNTIAAIFLIGNAGPTELVALSRRLAGIGRLFFAKVSLTRDELLEMLHSLVPPKLSRIRLDNEQLASVAAQSETVMAHVANDSVISQWVDARVTADDLKTKVCSEFERLLRDVQNAIK